MIGNTNFEPQLSKILSPLTITFFSLVDLHYTKIVPSIIVWISSMKTYWNFVFLPYNKYPDKMLSFVFWLTKPKVFIL